MPSRPTRPVSVRMRRLLAAWQADTRGVAAIEFALVAPLMAAMFVGAVEMSQAITVDRRVTQIAGSTADLVARADKTIAQSEISDIMRVGSYILKPYSATPIRIVLRNVTSSPANASQTKQSWTCSYNGTGGTQTCECTNTSFPLPANMVTTNDSVVVAEVTYDYVPLVFNYVMKNTWGGGGASYRLSETIYMKPRSQRAMLLQADGKTPCADPTF
ncbi:MAG: TadE/TadG family type IV pilus assembly protein [Hyphomicrobiaceae bacterium]|jgi:Flp pilus assembly protein TadG